MKTPRVNPKITDKLTQKTRVKDSDKIVFESEYLSEDNMGYSDNNISITVKDDGSMSFVGDTLEGEFVYLYSEQVKHLETILRKRKVMLKGK